MFFKKGVLKNFAKFTRKHCAGVFFFFIKKETPAEGFSFEFCEIYKNTIIYSAPLVAGSVMSEAVSLQLFKIGFVAGK